MTIDDLDDDTFDLLAGVNRSARYHDRRRLFYENWNSITAVLGALGLAVGGVQLYESSLPWALTLGFGSLWCASDAALGIAKKAVTHSDLYVRFVLLEKEFSSGRSLTPERLAEIRDERLEIESREPSLLFLLNELCQESYERSIGVEPKKVKLPKWRKLVVHFLSQEDFTKEKFHTSEPA